MRLLTAISIASLAVSVPTLVLVLWLIITEPWVEDLPVVQPALEVIATEPTEPASAVIATEPTEIPYRHTRLLTYDQMENILGDYLLTDPEGLVENPPITSPGGAFSVDGCLYSQSTFEAVEFITNPSTGGITALVKPHEPPRVVFSLHDTDKVTWSYLSDNSDRWLVTAVGKDCDGVKNLYFDDNTGKIIE